METNITQLSPVEYELEIKADRSVIDERINGQLKKIRPSVQMNGFRTGRVPIGMVKKLHGKAVAFEVVDEMIQEAYKSEVLDSPDHDVLGSPTVTELEYEPFGDLLAQLQFGVRPAFDLQPLSGETIRRLTHDIEADEIEREVEGLLARAATFESIEGPASDEDFIRVDLQELDLESDTPLLGRKQEGVVFHLSAEGLDEQVKQALVGKQKDDTARFSISQSGETQPNSDNEDAAAQGPDRRYEATVLEVQERTLPERDDEFAKLVTEGRIETFEELRADVEQRLEQEWERALREKLEDDLVRRVVELHDFTVPPSVVETYLDSQLQDIAQRNEGELPANFDIAYFKDQNRAEAERMSRWMLIRDRIVDEQAIGVEQQDLDAAFGEMGMGGGEGSSDAMRQFFEQNYPDMLERMERRIESKKVFDWLLDQVKLEDEPWEDERDR